MTDWRATKSEHGGYQGLGVQGPTTVLGLRVGGSTHPLTRIARPPRRQSWSLLRESCSSLHVFTDEETGGRAESDEETDMAAAANTGMFDRKHACLSGQKAGAPGAARAVVQVVLCERSDRVRLRRVLSAEEPQGRFEQRAAAQDRVNERTHFKLRDIIWDGNGQA